MHPNLALIVNPRSHTVRRKGARLATMRGEAGHYLELHDFSSVETDIHQLLDAGVNRIAVEGGDGTVLAVLSAALSYQGEQAEPPEFAVLPGGSTNLAYEILGLRSIKPAAIKERLLSDTGETITQRALCVTASSLPSPQVGFLLSTGALARAMVYVQHEFHGEGRRGALAVFSAVIRFLLQPGAYRDTDGHPILRASELHIDSTALHRAGPHLLSIMTTLPSLSLGIKPFWGGDHGAIALTLAGWPITGLRRALIQILLGLGREGLAKRGFASYRANKFELCHKDSLMLDGETLPIPEDGMINVSATKPLTFLR